MEHDIVPQYTSSPPSPQYSSELLPGEQTIEFTRRGAVSRSSTGVYRRITDHLTVILRGQHPGSIYPVYGQGGFIQGDVMLSNTSNLTSATLKLEGNFSLCASGIPLSSTFLSMTHVLWSTSHAHHCPRSIPFGIVLPLTFDDGGQVRALPPTFKSSELHVTCSYSLTVVLSRPRQLLPFLKGTEAVEIPLVYRPQSRPRLPMLSSDLPFMSTVKSSPEEWYEAMCTIPMTQGSGLAHAECLLFIPSVQTFALSDTIPFHLQIRGSPASLIPFLEQDQGGRQGTNGRPTGGIAIRVYLLRQFSARIHGQYAMASRNLGEGKMKPSEPLHPRNPVFARHPLGDGLDTLDWDGVLRFDEDTIVPSFSTNQLSVKSSSTTQVSAAGRNTLLFDTDRDRSLAKRYRDLVHEGMTYYASPVYLNRCEPSHPSYADTSSLWLSPRYPGSSMRPTPGIRWGTTQRTAYRIGGYCLYPRSELGDAVAALRTSLDA